MDIGTAYVNGQSMQLMGIVIFSMVIVFLIVMLLGKRKSQYYRKHIADMYVAAKIRLFAEEDKLDLVAEEKAFKKWTKKQASEYRDVDESVAEELKERVLGLDEETPKKK